MPLVVVASGRGLEEENGDEPIPGLGLVNEEAPPVELVVQVAVDTVHLLLGRLVLIIYIRVFGRTGGIPSSSSMMAYFTPFLIFIGGAFGGTRGRFSEGRNWPVLFQGGGVGEGSRLTRAREVSSSSNEICQ